MKIYTKTGDDGTTGLIGGTRVLKSDLRLECYGTIDELNATIGLAVVTAEASASELTLMLRQVQDELFIAGSHLATPADSPHRASLPELKEAAITRMETEIDAAVAQLPALKNFIMPGGTELAARLHFARTVCRRVERLLVLFSKDQPVESQFVIYFNRLSDWLFTQARRANQLAGVKDVPWRPRP